GSALFFAGENLIAANYSNLNAKLTPTGEVTLFQLKHGLNYGLAVSPKNDLIMGGGLSSFSLTKVDTMASVTGSADKLPSWPEYWEGFSSNEAASAVYGGTSGYRVFKLG